MNAATQPLDPVASATALAPLAAPTRCLRFAAATAIAIAAPLAVAQEVRTWAVGAGDFYAPANWDSGVPDLTDIAVINNGGTATIGLAAGDHNLGGLRLGDTQGSPVYGHVVMNGGFLRVGETQGDPKPVIGAGTTLSTFVMNGGTLYLDGPDLNPGNTNGKGVNELDWEVGELGVGRFEMHGDAVFRASDDVKIAENAAGNGTCLVDGTAILSVGSGISISGGVGAEQSMVIAGNALVECGNSMGAGNPEGQTDEGYLTMASGGGNSKLTIQDQAVLNIRRLTAREGTSFILVRDRAQFHIFDAFYGRGFIDEQTPPDRPEETGPNSTYASLAPSDATLILQDDAVMTVNSSQGLGISAPRDPGNPGGTARLLVRDRASLRVEQYLAIGSAAAESSIGSFEVRGPDADVSIGGDLNLACDPDGAPTPGSGTLIVSLTGPTQSKVVVGGLARLTNGRLMVKTDGFTPASGATFVVVEAAGIEGEFIEVDTAGAPLTGGATWAVDYAAGSITLRVAGGTASPFSITGASLSGNDIVLSWTGGTPPYSVERTTSLATEGWSQVATTATTQATVPQSGPASFYRVRSQ